MLKRHEERCLVHNYRRCRKPDRENIAWLASTAARCVEARPVAPRAVKALLLLAMLLGTVALPGLTAQVQAQRHPERAYQSAWCNEHGGEMEHVLPDRTRVDCLTAGHAVEVDFAAKWAEAVGQSLYYADRTGRPPGVLLIIEGQGDDRHLERIRRLAEKYDIKLWTITPDAIGGPPT